MKVRQRSVKFERWLGMMLVLASGLAWAADAPQGDPYLVGVCPVSGEKLATAEKPVVYTHEGREIRFCCSACVETFKKDPETYLKKIDSAEIEQQLPFYPLDTCLVSGGKLGAMGDPVNYVYKNRLVRFCCPGCVGKFEQDPAKYLAALDKAVVEKQKPAYPLTTCPVMGGKIEEGKGIDYVAGNRLIRFCCKDCVATFRKDPEKYLKQIDSAR